MIKSLKFNQIKKIRFISSTVLFIALLVFMLIPTSVTLIAPYGLVIIALVISTVSMVITGRVKKNGAKYIEDELSKENESKADKFVLKVITILLLLFSYVLMFTDFTVTITFYFTICLFNGIDALGNGYYLYLERSDTNNADLDDND